MLTDSFGRGIDYLRLSITDRCNFRCLYCMPESPLPFMGNDDALTDDEIEKLVSLFAKSGVSKIRITGGEPLVRPGIVSLVGRLAKVTGVQDLSLSTNGSLLAQYADALKNAGLNRVNISLDTLKPERFKSIARFGSLGSVLEGIEAALAAGLEPVKLNIVVARGMNDDEIPNFAALSEQRPLHVRFIELMPMGETGFFHSSRWLPWGKIKERAGPMNLLAKSSSPLGFGPARYFKKNGAAGTIGFISALGCGFCDSCNRLRLSSDGTLYPCLDAPEGINLKTPLRAGASDRELLDLIAEAVQKKPERHKMVSRMDARSANPRLMCKVGG